MGTLPTSCLLQPWTVSQDVTDLSDPLTETRTIAMKTWQTQFMHKCFCFLCRFSRRARPPKILIAMCIGPLSIKAALLFCLL